MAVQTVYNESIAGYRAGFIVNTEAHNIISRTVEDATAIEFGKPVSQGTNDAGCSITTTGDTEVIGITVRESSTDANTPDVFAQYDSAGIMTKGVICVEVGAAVVAGDPVHVILASSTFSNTGGLAIPNARYDSSGAANSIVKVRLG